MDRINFDSSSYNRSITSSLPDQARQALAAFFAHQTAVWARDPKDSIESHLAYRFYSKTYYVPAVLKNRGAGRVAEYSPEERNAMVAEFLDAVCYSDGARDRARTYYLLGNRGVGKTSFVSYCITRQMRRFVNDVDLPLRPRRIWFVRLEVEKRITRELFHARDASALRLAVLEHMAHQMVHVLNSNTELMESSDVVVDRLRHLEDHLTTRPNEMSLGQAVQQLVTAMSHEAPGRRLLLIVDNLDYVTHQYDDRLFSSEASLFAEILRSLYGVTRLFNHDNGPLGRMGVNVLLSVRPSTFDAIKAMHATQSWSTQLTTSGVFTLIAPPVFEVVKSRAELLKWATKQPGMLGRTDQPLFTKVSRLAKVLDAEIAETSLQSANRSTFLHTIDDLSCKSRRELMDFLQLYSAISDNHSEEHLGDQEDGQPVLNRLIAQENTGLIAFMLTDKTRFSEEQCRFPSLYLVSESGSDDRPPTYLSYWLRRLLVEYVVANGTQPVTRLVDLFSGDGTYPARLVEASLRQLAQTGRSQVLRCEWSWDEARTSYVPRTVEPTSRAFRLVRPAEDGRRPLADRFAYMQLICDEPTLWIPRHLVRYFRHDGWSQDRKSRMDYDYIGQKHRSDFQQGMTAMFNHKFKTVRLLIDLLDAAWRAEVNRAPVLFRSLGYTAESGSASDSRDRGPVSLGQRLMVETLLGMRRVHDKVHEHVDALASSEELAAACRQDTEACIARVMAS